MPAHNNTFPWVSYYKNYDFFENRIKTHSKVHGIREAEPGLYEMDLTDGRKIRVFVCECYSFGLAEYYESKENLGTIDAIIINSKWCGYTFEAKRYCLKHRVGLFDIAGFMAALNKDNFWEYLTDHETETFRKNGWI